MPQGQILRRFITAWWRRLWKNSFLRVIPSRQLQVGDGPVGAEVGGQRRLRQDGASQHNQGNQTYDDPQDGTFRGQQTPSALLITRTRGTPITAITASTAKPTAMNTVIHIPSSLQKELTPSLHAWPSPEPPLPS